VQQNQTLDDEFARPTDGSEAEGNSYATFSSQPNNDDHSSILASAIMNFYPYDENHVVMASEDTDVSGAEVGRVAGDRDDIHENAGTEKGGSASGAEE